ncbi:hypothetical protein [Scatolibacter rhodanostii]|uniref:hypothetical protein n=1 Tax=Scatolibacter rhodanostii TaxID=2014781 RepID=UPI00135631B2|nr:hypothetical protein [Scatolibacter rhodanostii]
MATKRISGFEQFAEDYTAAIDQAYYISEDELADMVDVLFDSSNDIEETRSINIEAEKTVENEPLTFNFTLLLDDDRQQYIEYRGYF